MGFFQSLRGNVKSSRQTLRGRRDPTWRQGKLRIATPDLEGALVDVGDGTADGELDADKSSGEDITYSC